MDLKEFNPTIGITHWYYATKLLTGQKFLERIGSRSSAQSTRCVLVDVGAGSGIFTKAFLSAWPVSSAQAYAVDVDYPDARLGVDDGVQFVRRLPKGIVPTHLLLLDVLEHVDNDFEFLREWVIAAAPGSVFFVTVPAFQFLWSEHDVFLGHKRRYTLTELERLVSRVGLVVLHSRYLFATAFPIAVVVRKILEPIARRLGIGHSHGIQPVNHWVNELLKRLLAIEVAVGSRNRWFGLSCVLLAKKSQ